MGNVYVDVRLVMALANKKKRKKKRKRKRLYGAVISYCTTFFQSSFLQLCSIVRDMSVKVRLQVFDAIGKITMASENILLQTLSKKVLIKTQTSDVAGAFVHGMEDEFYEVTSRIFNKFFSFFGIHVVYTCINI